MGLTLSELDRILAHDGEGEARGLLLRGTDHSLALLGPDAESAEDVTRLVQLSGFRTSESAVLALAERVRALADRSLVSKSASHQQIELYAETLEWRRREYCTSPPLAILTLLLDECREIQELALGHHPAAVQRRLSELTANYATLIADALMKLGEQRPSRKWYSTAILAADDTEDVLLRAQVRAQAAMLPYYYGHVAEALRLTREAQLIVGGRTGSPVALAAAGEARALARLGNTQDAKAALRRCQEAFECADEPDEEIAFRFTERRLMLYLSGTLTNLGETRQAADIQRAALARYGADDGIDPVLVHLDQAICLALDGALTDGCQLAQATLTAMPAQHRTGVVLARTADLIAAIPEAHHASRAVTHLRETLALPTGH